MCCVSSEEGKDYEAVNKTLWTLTNKCVTVNIIDDDESEMDETFTVVFSELDREDTPDEYGSGGSGKPGDNDMLMPMMVNLTVAITIKDDDHLAKEGKK